MVSDVGFAYDFGICGVPADDFDTLAGVGVAVVVYLDVVADLGVFVAQSIEGTTSRQGWQLQCFYAESRTRFAG